MRWIFHLMTAAALLVPSALRANDVPQERLDQITEAVPDKPQAKPQAPRKLLVFTKTAGFRHKSIPTGIAAMKILGEKTGAFTIEHSEDPKVFAAENLSRFDAVCMLNTTGSLFKDEALRQSLHDFVAGGKGLVGIHSATDTFYDWPEFGDMMGGYFAGHPWHEKVTLKVEDTSHACNQCFEGKSLFEITDEIYQFRDKPYSRDILRVLTSLDNERTNMKKRARRGPDGDYAVSWVHRYEKGRVFYCSLGHRDEIYWNPVVLGHYLAGIQFAFGDLEADTTPSNKLVARFKGADGAAFVAAVAVNEFGDLAKYKYPGDRSALTKTRDAVHAAASNPVRLRAIEKQLLPILAAPDTSVEAKQFICRQLVIAGSSQSVPTLAKLLADPKLADVARIALERIDAPEAGAALRNGLKTLNGEQLVGLIGSVGRRKDAKAVDQLAGLAKSNDPLVSSAAINALGDIADANAHKAVQALGKPHDAGIATATLKCADAMAASGKTADAATIYGRIASDTKYSRGPRLAAIRGLILTDAGKAQAAIADAAKSDDQLFAQKAVGLVRQMPAGEARDAFIRKFDKMPVNLQPAMLSALVVAAGSDMTDTLIGALKSDDTLVRMTAINELANMEGGGRAVGPLAKLALGGSNDEKVAAKQTLSRLPGENVDAQIGDMLDANDPAKRQLAIELLADRGGKSGKQLAKLLTAKNSDIRLTAIKAMEKVGEESELKPLVEIVASTSDGGERSAAAKSATAVARRVGGKADKTIAAGLSNATPEGKVELLNVLAAVGGDNALKTVREIAAGSDGQLKDAAYRAMMNWSDASPAEDLLALAATTDSNRNRILSIRALARMIPQAEASNDAKAAMFEKAFAAAKTADDRKVLIGALGNVPHAKTLKLAEGFLNDNEVKREAEAAVKRIQRNLR